MVSVVKLQLWAENFLPNSTELTGSLTLVPLNGDAGFRQYFRTNTNPVLIAVSAPPDREDNPAFVSKALAMRAHGLHVPQIFAVDYQQGFLLLEDLGDGLLLSQLNQQSIERLYGAAEQALLQLQSMPVDSSVFPAYSDELLDNEMALFPEWFVDQLLGLSLNEGEQKMLRQTFDLLLESARQQPQVVVHRDYHSRNLLEMANGEIAMVDFQDGVIGPLTYDLVSLLRDCYIRWPTEQVGARALAYAERAGLLKTVSEQQFMRWFDLMGLQRHIKVLGIFARLWLRDGKSGYLNDLPLVIRYTLEQARPYPELAEFVSWFEARVVPALSQQDWYQPWQTAGDTAENRE